MKMAKEAPIGPPPLHKPRPGREGLEKVRNLEVLLILIVCLTACAPSSNPSTKETFDMKTKCWELARQLSRDRQSTGAHWVDHAHYDPAENRCVGSFHIDDDGGSIEFLSDLQSGALLASCDKRTGDREDYCTLGNHAESTPSTKVHEYMNLLMQERKP